MRTFRLLGFGSLGLSVLIMVLLLSLVGAQTVQVNNLRRQVSEKETRIGELVAIEEKVVGLADKNNALTQIFGERDYYSILLEALRESIPAGVDVTGLSTSQGEVTVGLSGEIRGYIALAQFLRNLVDPEKGGSLFTQAGLTSVTFDRSSGKAKFVAEVTVVEDGLKKGWKVLLE